VLVRLMMPIVRRKFHQTQQAILAALKDAAEKRAEIRREQVHVNPR
jgi:hypothetical protein